MPLVCRSRKLQLSGAFLFESNGTWVLELTEPSAELHLLPDADNKKTDSLAGFAICSLGTYPIAEISPR